MYVCVLCPYLNTSYSPTFIQHFIYIYHSLFLLYKKFVTITIYLFIYFLLSRRMTRINIFQNE